MSKPRIPRPRSNGRPAPRRTQGGMPASVGVPAASAAMAIALMLREHWGPSSSRQCGDLGIQWTITGHALDIRVRWEGKDCISVLCPDMRDLTHCHLYPFVEGGPWVAALQTELRILRAARSPPGPALH